MNYILFLDFDGTLAPIVSKPTLAKLTKSHKNLLKQLAKQKNVTLALISGRQLSDLKKRVGLPGVYYAGNHGFEIIGPKIKKIHPKALKAKPILNKILQQLKTGLKSFPGVIIEDKSLTLSIHYRLARKKDIAKISKIFSIIVKPYLKLKKIRVTKGKKVFEIRPNIDWHKGKAVSWLLKQLTSSRVTLPIYIGDDTTDEDAFIALNKHGFTIRVSKDKNSQAKYFLKDVADVYRFLGLFIN